MKQCCFRKTLVLVCEDGEVIPAHKNILAATCSYFKAAFSGHWKESNKDELEIQHSSHIVIDVLKMLYTGVVTASVVNKEPLAFVSIAAELDLPWLTLVAEKSLSESVDVSYLKDYWQTARLYDNDRLKNACISFAKKNAVAVLARGEIVLLKSDDSPSWDKFAKGLEE